MHARPSLLQQPARGGGSMNFATVGARRSGRAAPSLRDTPQRQLTSKTGRTSIYRKRNAVQTKPATSNLNHNALASLRLASIRFMLRRLCNPS